MREKLQKILGPIVGNAQRIFWLIVGNAKRIFWLIVAIVVGAGFGCAFGWLWHDYAMQDVYDVSVTLSIELIKLVNHSMTASCLAGSAIGVMICMALWAAAFWRRKDTN